MEDRRAEVLPALRDDLVAGGTGVRRRRVVERRQFLRRRRNDVLCRSLRRRPGGFPAEEELTCRRSATTKDEPCREGSRHYFSFSVGKDSGDAPRMHDPTRENVLRGRERN